MLMLSSSSPLYNRHSSIRTEDYVSETFGRGRKGRERKGEAKVRHFSNLISQWLNYSPLHFIYSMPLIVYSPEGGPPPLECCTHQPLYLKTQHLRQTSLIRCHGWADESH